MASKKSIAFFSLLFLSLLHPHASLFTSNSSSIQFPTHPSFNSNSPCDHRRPSTPPPAPLKLHLRQLKQSLLNSTLKDFSRIQTILANKNDRKKHKEEAGQRRSHHRRLSETAAAMMATLESGVSLGSGEYLMDVFVGTPPRHFSVILDTGSDLNWLQCLPCRDCFDQHGPVFDPAASSSYRAVTCGDSRCSLVASSSTSPTCRSPAEPCPYFYWYGDQSNTTGDLAVETFTVNLTSSSSPSRRVHEVLFGCGHWNRGLFRGAAGLLGLGRGPLSFASQLSSLYGHGFSYCLVDRDSDISVSSKLIFGEDEQLLSHPHLNYTSFVSAKNKNNNNDSVDTFYYVQIKTVSVDGVKLNISQKLWELADDGSGGTIVDSGTTLTYFADPAYQIIREAFLNSVKTYPVIEDFPVLSPCYNVSGVDRLELPSFAIEFADGANWEFPTENYFIRLEPEIVCLAILGTPRSALSILGNYQQQNFHVLYDLKNSRLGFAPRRCAEV
ncbi:aspartic proteinase nepenthesin-1-like [Typha angustifolia]|uniref:aspartic proteinase nepenthesin-1-like n=1 Tax=Typha angustifolia TaxID=59011 RepID=UPI003C307380